MRVLISGGTGFIGRRLIAALLKDQAEVTVLSRRGGAPAELGLPAQCGIAAGDLTQAETWQAALNQQDAVVHLAGEPVGPARWTGGKKKRIRDSRVLTTAALAEAVGRLPVAPRTLIQASGVGIYGDCGDLVLEEDAPAGKDFLARVAVEWEAAGQAAGQAGTRVVQLRAGLVMDARGGALPRLLTPLRWGIGGRLGSGRQWVSWIDLDDLVRLALFALNRTTLKGPVNAVSPEPVRNAELIAALAQWLRRPAQLPVPAWGLRAALGEGASLLLYSQRARPAAAMAAGFEFQRPTLEQGLSHWL